MKGLKGVNESMNVEFIIASEAFCGKNMFVFFDMR